MTILPTLPSCGQPASKRIKIYTPNPDDGAHRSLDWTWHACPQHLDAVVAAIDAAKLWAYPVPGVVVSPVRWGQGFDFTGPYAEPHRPGGGR